MDSVELPADADEFFAAAYELGWTDGLPVIPPTEDRVEEMLGGRPADESLGAMPPANADLTLGLLAVNAVMAGCSAESFPALVAAASALLEPDFNLLAIQATTHPTGPVAVYNGSVRARLGLAAGTGSLGPGPRANLTLGRALRLTLLNVGGASPGIADLATQGQPGKLAFVTAENEEESPWEPLSVALGFSPGDDVVTVLAGEGPRNVNDANSRAAGLLHSLAASLTVPTFNNWFYDSNVLLLLCPEHASALATGGLSRADVQAELFRRARLPESAFSPDVIERYGGGLKRADDDADRTRLVASPEDILIAVVGGAGRHSSFVASFGNTRVVSRRLEG
jgi:hypothetical protein